MDDDKIIETGDTTTVTESATTVTADTQVKEKETVQETEAEAREKMKAALRAEMEAEFAEKERISKLSADEKAELEKQQKDKKIADLEAEITKRDLKDKAITSLNKDGFPSELSTLLDYSNADSFNSSLKQVKEVFKDALAKAMNEKLKGKTPERLHDDNSVAERDLIAQSIRGGF